MNVQDQKKIPSSPGVYLFKKGQEILYVGKATFLKERIKSYGHSNLTETRGPLIVQMIKEANRVDWKKTDSVLEALILETELIKKYQPKYNTKEKSDCSFNYVGITQESWPRVLVVREKEIKDPSNRWLGFYGPFTQSTQLKAALKIVRRLFPYRSDCQPNCGRPCFNFQIGLCPGVCIGAISQKDYLKQIKNLKLFFSNRKRIILKNIKKEMQQAAKKQDFESAGVWRNRLLALTHIQDVAIITSEVTTFSPPQSSPLAGETGKGDHSDNRGGCFRIEAYDVSHFSGSNNVGTMVVLENGELKKSDYRKFKIKETKGNDVGALKEILDRRFKHTEWANPHLIVLDGGLAQLNIARKIFQPIRSDLPRPYLVAVTKDNKHKAKMIIGNEKMIKKYQKEILLANNEAHRSAVAFHRQKRSVII